MKDILDLHLHGKLLLTGEYFVLDGVPALAVPTTYGQRFQVHLARGIALEWRAAVRGEEWYRGTFHTDPTVGVPADPVSQRLWQILQAANELQPGILPGACFGRLVSTNLDFDRDWGLGSSSTLIAGIAAWLEVDPYALLEKTFGGSGYDLACAVAAGPIVYTRAAVPGGQPRVRQLDWRPEWTAQAYFVHRNQKQNSREGIEAYRAARVSAAAREEIGQLTTALTDPALHPRAAAQILHDHERLVGETLGMQPVQKELFADFPGQLKSLGAWGGDFVLALSEAPAEKVYAYFNDRGFRTVIAYADMAL